MSAEMEKLAARCEALAGPDRATDRDIADVLGLGPDGTWERPRSDRHVKRLDEGSWIKNGLIRDAKRYTASLDAVRTLIGDDEWDLSTQHCIARATVGIERDHQTSWPGYGEHAGNDPVLALLAAALRAIALRARPTTTGESGL